MIDSAPKSIPLKRQDFESDQEVRWCPGCGDYAILATMQKTLPTLGLEKENIVFVSGIGCSSRFPYYLSTYGFHTIHGRAPAIATGVKCANPDLSVFVVTGDGDGLSIGSNHLLHLIRRNLDVTVLLFNNRIYGLTKGQYSPTSEAGKKTKSSPDGSIEQPICPIRFAFGANASFIARAIDVDAKGLSDVLTKAVAHKGTSFVEIYQNCNVFNDGAFSGFSERAARAEHTLHLELGQPMLFGQNQDKAICLEEGQLAIRPADQCSPLIHDGQNEGVLWSLLQKQWPEFPVVTGVFKQHNAPLYESQLATRKPKPLSELMTKNIWQV